MLRQTKWKAIIAGLAPSPKNNKRMDLLAARHFYDQLNRILSKKNYIREIHQTPGEFLTSLTLRNHPSITEIKFVTDTFCNIRYGENELTEELQSRVNESIDTVRKNCQG